MTTAACRGFVYATAVMGVTGTRTTTADLAGAPGRPHQGAATDLPVGVGLGVSNGAQAAEVAAYADGVIVGSAFVRALLDHPDDRAAGLRALTRADRGPRRRGTACVGRLAAAGRPARSPLTACGGGTTRATGGSTARVLDPPFEVLVDAADRHRRPAVLADRGHRQGPDAGLLRLHRTAPTSARR